MSSYLTTSIRAVWTKLKAGANVPAYMTANNGHYYEETETSKKAMQLTKSDLPAIIMVPALSAIRIMPRTNVSYDVSLPLSFDARVEDRAVDAIIDFYEMILRDLYAAWKDSNFGLDPSLGLHTIEPGGATVTDLYEEVEGNQLVRMCWKAEFQMVLNFRRVIESA